MDEFNLLTEEQVSEGLAYLYDTKGEIIITYSNLKLQEEIVSYWKEKGHT